MNGGKSHTLIAVYKGVIVNQRFQQRCRFFADVVVVICLGTENRGFQSALIPHAVSAAVFLDLVMVNYDDFGHGQ